MRKFTLLSMFVVLVSFLAVQNVAAQGTNGSKEVVEVATIADLRAQEVGTDTEYLITGEVILIYQQSYRNKKWVQDATGGIEIDDNDGIITSEYSVGDGITGLQGKLSAYNNLLQFTPTVNPPAATSTANEETYVERTLADLTADDQCRLVLVNGVRFDAEDIGSNFATGKNYNVTDESGAAVFRTEFYEADYIGNTIPSAAQNIKVIVRQYGETMQITARFASDFEPAEEEPTYTITFNIIGENDEAITDAVVTFNEVENAAGNYVFEEISTGTYNYSVVKTGYHTRTGEMVVAGEDITKTLVLVAVSDDMVEEFPWTEGFEEAVPPSTWHAFSLGDGSWATTTAANGGEAAAFHNFVQSGAADSWLVSPQISIPAEGEKLLKFYEKNGLMTDYGYSGVKISTGSGVPEHNDFVDIYESEESINNYTQKIIDLSEYAGSVVYIAFVYQGENAHQWYVDDVTIEDAPEAIEVADIATLRQQEEGSIIYHLTGEAIITHQHGQRNQKYIQDATGAIVIDDDDEIITTVYNLYDGVTGIKGTLSSYAGLIQFIPVEDPGAATSTGNEVTPLEVTLSELTTDHQSMLVKVLGVEFDTDETTFSPSKSYDIFDASGTSVLRTPSMSSALDYFDTEIPTVPVDMVAIVSQYNEDMQIFPRSLADMVEATSVDANTFAKPSVFPNPFNDQINVENVNGTITRAIIHNILGQVVINVENASNSMVINSSKLSKGVYLIRFENDKGQYSVVKMVKK
ncbi:MAG TPA: DUF5689 domain-containing protein [Tenuifilaceae bacterium]|nr:DUF5689 domain-containing protein [Tenuifilaceae bacterium]